MRGAACARWRRSESSKEFEAVSVEADRPSWSRMPMERVSGVSLRSDRFCAFSEFRHTRSLNRSVINALDLGCT